MTEEEFLEIKAEKMQALKDLAYNFTLLAKDPYYTGTLNLFGSSLQLFIEFGDISELYIRNSLSFLLSHNIIFLEDYEKIDALIRQAVELHETVYCD